MVGDNRLLRSPDHIQELWHSEAIKAVISYWAMGLLYVWAKVLICSGKTFYHDTTEEFILHRKDWKTSLCHSTLWSIWYPVSWVLCRYFPISQGIQLVRKRQRKAVGLLLLEEQQQLVGRKTTREAQWLPMKPFWHRESGQDWQGLSWQLTLSGLWAEVLLNSYSWGQISPSFSFFQGNKHSIELQRSSAMIS